MNSNLKHNGQYTDLRLCERNIIEQVLENYRDVSKLRWEGEQATIHTYLEESRRREEEGSQP